MAGGAVASIIRFLNFQGVANGGGEYSPNKIIFGISETEGGCCWWAGCFGTHCCGCGGVDSLMWVGVHGTVAQLDVPVRDQGHCNGLHGGVAQSSDYKSHLTSVI